MQQVTPAKTVQRFAVGMLDLAVEVCCDPEEMPLHYTVQKWQRSVPVV